MEKKTLLFLTSSFKINENTVFLYLGPDLGPDLGPGWALIWPKAGPVNSILFFTVQAHLG